MNAKLLWRVTVSAGLGAALLGLVGCEEATTESAAGNSPRAAGSAGGDLGAPPGAGPGAAGEKGRSSPIRAIMFQLDRGPTALNKAVAKGLEADQPDWGTIQKQASTYAQLVSGL